MVYRGLRPYLNLENIEIDIYLSCSSAVYPYSTRLQAKPAGRPPSVVCDDVWCGFERCTLAQHPMPQNRQRFRLRICLWLAPFLSWQIRGACGVAWATPLCFLACIKTRTLTNVSLIHRLDGCSVIHGCVCSQGRTVNPAR